jgi:hypothetical protein
MFSKDVCSRGGKSHAASLTAAQRSELARIAATARWAKKDYTKLAAKDGLALFTAFYEKHGSGSYEKSLVNLKLWIDQLGD